jgi:hypothetical protein
VDCFKLRAEKLFSRKYLDIRRDHNEHFWSTEYLLVVLRIGFKIFFVRSYAFNGSCHYATFSTGYYQRNYDFFFWNATGYST